MFQPMLGAVAVTMATYEPTTFEMDRQARRLAAQHWSAGGDAR